MYSMDFARADRDEGGSKIAGTDFLKSDFCEFQAADLLTFLFSKC
jgi:hypothetical protein